MASSTRVTRSGATLGAWFTTRETVLRLTPARAATSCMVGALVEAERAGSWDNVISPLLPLEGATAASLTARLDKTARGCYIPETTLSQAPGCDAGPEEGPVKVADRLAPRRRWRVAGAGIVAIVALLAAGCSGRSSESGSGSQGGQVQVGLITKTETNPFFVKMKEGAEKEAAAKGAKLLTAAGKFDGDNASQATAIENMVAAGVKGILITPSDTKAIVPSIQKARDKGVEVIALDTPTDPQSAVDALFATNNFQAGVLIGKYAKAAMGSKPARIATLDLAPGITVGILRHNGFLSGYGAANVDQNATQLATG